MIAIQAKLTFDPPDALSARAVRRMNRAGYQAVGEYWHENFAPLHFKPGASQRYGYQPRKETYLKSKQAKARSQKPVNRAGYRVREGGTQELVYTGQLRKLVTDYARIRSFPTRLTVELVGPKYLRGRVKPGHPDIAGEVTAVSPAEIEELSHVFTEACAAAFESEQARPKGRPRKARG